MEPPAASLGKERGKQLDEDGDQTDTDESDNPSPRIAIPKATSKRKSTDSDSDDDRGGSKKTGSEPSRKGGEWHGPRRAVARKKRF